MNDYLDEIEQKSLDASIPLRAIIELTYRCDFACVHCYCTQSTPGVELSTAHIKDILRQLAECGTLVLTLTGGEVLARPDFVEIARYARELRFALRWFSNGSGWDEKMAEKARDLHPLSVDVSLYGSSPEVYEAVTGDGGNFSLAHAGIRNLKRHAIPVTVKLPVLEENYQDLPGMINICRELKVPYTMSANITPRNDGSPAPLAHAISFSRIRDFLSRYEQPTHRGSRRPDDYVCNTARNTAVISPYGDVYPCIQIRESAGNVIENDFRSIWVKSASLNRLRRLRVKDLKGCAGCTYLDRCSYCPGIAFWESGSFMARDRMACQWTHARADVGLMGS